MRRKQLNSARLKWVKVIVSTSFKMLSCNNYCKIPPSLSEPVLYFLYFSLSGPRKNIRKLKIWRTSYFQPVLKAFRPFNQSKRLSKSCESPLNQGSYFDCFPFSKAVNRLYIDAWSIKGYFVLQFALRLVLQYNLQVI